jgi:putative methyltransferase (TIGR04325 family)
MARQVLEGPVARPALLRWKRKQFLSEAGFCDYFGVFSSFAAARASLPASSEFDHATLARGYLKEHCRSVFEYDYPMMWWLDRAFRGGASVVLDIGGSVGVHYYGYRSYLDMPRNLEWRVAEVPAMVQIGRELAAKSDGGALRFTEDLGRSLAGANVWISAGALQYFEEGRPSELLKRCEAALRPRHLLLNKLPLYAGEDFVTTQNIGDGCFSPVHVYNRDRFIRDIEDLGYTLRDRWEVHERSLYVPGHPERTIAAFSGLCFVADEAPAPSVPAAPAAEIPAEMAPFV